MIEEKKLKDETNITLPSNWSLSRKAAYQYGWDWVTLKNNNINLK